MSATLLLKRTLGTSPPNIAPVGTGVSFGELVYTYDTSDVGAGKSYKKLYIGNPAGPTATPIVIGGEYYTSLIPESPANYGNREANKALILDSNAKVKSWSVVTDFHNAGVGTNQGDFYVGGNLNVTGDLVYDEVTGRNINITGIGTIATIFNTKATIVDGSINNLFTVSGLVTTLTGTSANYTQVNVGHALTANNVEITGITTLTNNLDFSRNLIKIGRETASGISSADGSIFIGDYAATGMGQSTLNRRNIAIGASALQFGGVGNNADELESNIVMGNFAGYRLQGTKNLMVGDKVGFALSSSGNDENIALGNQAMYGDTFPVVDGVTLSISVGQQTAIANHDESTDVTETSGSGQGLIVRLQTGGTGLVTLIDVISPGDGYVLGDTFTIPFGFQTLTGSVTSINGRFLSGGTGNREQSRNIALGPYALYSVDGSKNIAIGYSAGDTTTGSGNVIIGYDQEPALPDQDNQLVIGTENLKWISGNSDGWVGIGTTTPVALLTVNGDVSISGVATVPQLDVNDLGIEDIKVTAGLATDFAITNAKIQSGIITDTVGTAATITNVDFVNADILAAKITAGIVTDIVGTAATITTFDTETADLKDVKITTGLVTSLVGTYATITTFDADDADINVLKTVTGVVTSLTGFGVTYNTADFEFVDASDIKITTGLVTSLVGTYVTFQDADFQDDVRVGGALTVVGDLTVQGNTSFVQSSVIQVTDKNIELGFSSTGNHANATADNGGVILKGTTDKTILYNQAREAWESNIKWNPDIDDTLDIGEPAVQWRDIYINGTAHLDAADILDAKITAGIITSQVGTYATIGTVDIETLDAKDVNITGLAVTDIVGTAATITTIDATDGDIVNAKITAGVVTSLVGTYSTIGDVDVTYDIRVGGALTITGDIDANGDLDVDGHAELDQLRVSGVGTIPTFDTETADLKNVKITAGIITDIVGTGATITTIDANSFDTVNAKINTGLATNFTVGQTIGDGSLTINSPVGLNSHTDIPDNVEVRIGDNTDFKIYHQDTDAFNNRGHVILQHANGNTTYGRVQVRSDYFSVQTAAGNSDFLMTDDKTLKLMYADTNASGVGDRVIIRASGTELLGISSFIDNGVYKGEVSIGTSITATAGVITANAIDLADADILDAKITAGLATDFAITNLKSQSGIITDLNVVSDIRVGGAMTVTGIATFQNDVFVGGNLNVVGDVVYDEIDGRNINITGISTLNNLIVTGISTISDLLIGAGSSTTKITTNSGELVLDSTAGQVTIQDNVHVVGYATFKNGLYYRSDQGGSTGIGYSGPNGMAYFEDDGRLVSSASTVGFLTTSNYVMTTNASGVPQWTNSIDGGFF